MLVKCPRCGTICELDAALVSSGFAPVQCTQCEHAFSARAAGGDSQGALVFGAPTAQAGPRPRGHAMVFGAAPGPPPMTLYSLPGSDRVFGVPAAPPAPAPAPTGRTMVFGPQPTPPPAEPSRSMTFPHSRLAALAEEYAELFRAVVDAPDDDLPRQVLADRLSEKGDRLGELITIQVAAGRAPARGLTRAREQELLAVHANTLVPRGVTDAAIVRGFACDCRVAGQVEDIADPAWMLVERAGFHHLSAHGLLVSGVLRSARELEGLNANDLDSLLRGQPPARLSRLQVQRLPLEGVPWSLLAERLPALEALELWGTAVDVQGLEGALAAVAASGARLARLRVDAARLELRQARALLGRLRSPLVLECQFGASWVELSVDRVRRCHEETDFERESAVRAQLRGLGLAEVELVRPPRGLFRTHHTPDLSGKLRVFPPAAARPVHAGRPVSTAPPRPSDFPDPNAG